MAENQFVILDLLHRDKVLDAKIIKVSNTEILWYRFSKVWASDQRLYFAIKTSHSYQDVLQVPKKRNGGSTKDSIEF
jgi:hypothetical protein